MIEFKEVFQSVSWKTLITSLRVRYLIQVATATLTGGTPGGILIGGTPGGILTGGTPGGIPLL